MMRLLYYQTASGRLPFAQWLKELRDPQARLLLLCGGDKSRQDKDIQRAKDYFRDYKARAAGEDSPA
jgi:putative component of toxin-antitoxin plasmid stabilization module